jgi:transglutaminase-like putative cysteine protease
VSGETRRRSRSQAHSDTVHRHAPAALGAGRGYLAASQVAERLGLSRRILRYRGSALLFTEEELMQIRAGYELIYQFPQPTPMILTLNIHHTRACDLVQPDHLITDPAVPISVYRDKFGNWCSRLVAPGGRMRLSADAIVRDSGQPEPIVPNASQHEVQDLPEETLLFLLGSRYCETDCLMDSAWKLFSNTALGWPRVQAICDFVHHHLVFGYQYASSTKSALQAFNDRNGVCRDFAHLAITFCRCMNIPARYCTGYLGDIGVPPMEAPMDFSGWFEAYLAGRWYAFDARHNHPRIGRILIARGRDAADVAISTAFGAAKLESFRVWTDQIA